MNISTWSVDGTTSSHKGRAHNIRRKLQMLPASGILIRKEMCGHCSLISRVQLEMSLSWRLLTSGNYLLLLFLYLWWWIETVLCSGCYRIMFRSIDQWKKDTFLFGTFLKETSFIKKYFKSQKTKNLNFNITLLILLSTQILRSCQYITTNQHLYKHCWNCNLILKAKNTSKEKKIWRIIKVYPLNTYSS